MKFYIILLIGAFCLNGCSLGAPQSPLSEDELAQELTEGEVVADSSFENSLFATTDEEVGVSSLLDLANATDVDFFINLAKEDNVDLMEMFILSGKIKGLDELESGTGRTVLHYANSSEMASMLWDIDVFLGYSEKHGKSRSRALYEKAFKIVDLSGQSAHQYMALTGAKGAVVFALEELCSRWSVDLLNQTDLQGRNISHLSVLSGDVVLVDTVSDCKFVEINEKDEGGETALHYAVKTNDAALVYAVVAHEGVDVDYTVKNQSGETALELADASISIILNNQLK